LKELHINNAVNGIFDNIYNHDIKNNELTYILQRLATEVAHKKM
jgi:hypothetical protein